MKGYFYQVRNPEQVVAIGLSDLHLRHKPPRIRAGAPDGYAAQERGLSQICCLQNQCNGVPVLIAGDLFHHWTEPSELIAFALRHLPNNIYAIPGQHDLPNHRYEERHRGAYGVLERAGRIHNLKPNELLITGGRGLVVSGSPWGSPPTPPPQREGKDHPTKHIYVNLRHEYVWVEGNHNNGEVQPKNHIKNFAIRNSGFDVTLVGDNHSSFIHSPSTDETYINCGCAQIQSRTELHYTPSVYLISNSGLVQGVRLNGDKDV